MFRPNWSSSGVHVELTNQLVFLKMTNYAETCSVYICNEEKNEQQPKLHADGRNILKSQIDRVNQDAAIYYYL
jgi:hypothetical protein